MLAGYVLSQLDRLFAETNEAAKNSMRREINKKGLRVLGDITIKSSSMVQSADPGERFNMVVIVGAEGYDDKTREIKKLEITCTYVVTV